MPDIEVSQYKKSVSSSFGDSNQAPQIKVGSESKRSHSVSSSSSLDLDIVGELPKKE